MNINFSYFFSLLLRSLFLGGIVFTATTYIPETIPSIKNRLLIAAVVAILYVFIDYIQYLLRALRNVTCNVACGCNPADSSNSNALDLDTLTKSLDIDTPIVKGTDAKKCST